jgi:hypothetical protein
VYTAVCTHLAALLAGVLVALGWFDWLMLTRLTVLVRDRLFRMRKVFYQQDLKLLVLVGANEASAQGLQNAV